MGLRDASPWFKKTTWYAISKEGSQTTAGSRQRKRVKEKLLGAMSKFILLKQIMSCIQNCKQVKGKTVANYCHRLETIWKEHSGLEINYQTSFSLATGFLNGLSLELSDITKECLLVKC